jgi:hypothetical protein
MLIRRSNSPGSGSDLVASWNATSFATVTDDFIDQGMAVVITFHGDDTYEIAFTNDLVGARDPGSDCTTQGDYAATATTVTLKPGTADEITFDYNIVGDNLTMPGGGSSVHGPRARAAAGGRRPHAPSAGAGAAAASPRSPRHAGQCPGHRGDQIGI